MPRIKTTRMAKVALYFLQVYLFFLLSLIMYKFIKTVW
jgi:hypothetical protein